MVTKLIQYIDEFKLEQDAVQSFQFLQSQIDYRGGRILPPSISEREWRVQVFFDHEGIDDGGWLPDGCRTVTVTDGMRTRLGIEEAA